MNLNPFRRKPSLAHVAKTKFNAISKIADPAERLEALQALSKGLKRTYNGGSPYKGTVDAEDVVIGAGAGAFVGLLATAFTAGAGALVGWAVFGGCLLLGAGLAAAADIKYAFGEMKAHSPIPGTSVRQMRKIYKLQKKVNKAITTATSLKAFNEATTPQKPPAAPSAPTASAATPRASAPAPV
jgi:hypothetical protein